MSDPVFERLIESVPHLAVRGCDAEGRVIYWNAGCERLYGYSLQQALGAPIASLIADDAERATLLQTYAHAAATGEPPPAGPLRLRDRRGAPVMVQSSHAVRTDHHGQPLLYSVDADLGPALARETALREANAGLERNARLRTELMSLLAHELRTPLVGIQGFSELLLHRAASVEEREFAEPIHRSALRLWRLVESFLEASDLAMSGTPAALSPVALAEQVRVAAEQARNQSEGFTGRVDLDLVDTGAQVLADTHRVTRIATILIGNAMKFAPRGTIVVATRCDGDRLTLSVEDDGPGIAAGSADRVFEPFFTGEEFATRTAEGAGLGLFIAHRHALAMGAQLVLVAPQRSRFELRLARAQPARPKDPQPKDPQPENPRPKNPQPKNQ